MTEGSLGDDLVFLLVLSFIVIGVTDSLLLFLHQTEAHFMLGVRLHVHHLLLLGAAEPSPEVVVEEGGEEGEGGEMGK